MHGWSRPDPSRALLLALLVTTVLLGGCTGADEGADGGGPSTSPTPPPGPGETAAPVWNVTDWWTYDASEGDGMTLVVTEETSNDWIIDTDSGDLAFFHAQDAVSTLGAQRKGDLAGSQGETRVEFFRWPLTDGDNWTTTWDGAERTITATAGRDGIFSFEAHEDGELVVRYSYDPAVRWFRTLEFMAPDGSVAFGWTLESSGTGWTGEVVRWDLEEILAFDSMTASYSIRPLQFEVPADATDVWASITVDCTSGAIIAGVHPQPWDDQDIGARWDGTCTTPFGFMGSLGHATGTWTADFAWQDATPGDLAYTLYVRTSEQLAVG